MSELIINPRFKELLPPLSKMEFEQLEKSVLDEGIREPIKVWHNQIIDGHNRHDLATKHDLPFAVIDMFFDSEDDVCEWMIVNQLGRRNLEPNIKTLFIGELYKLQKKRVGAPEENQHANKNKDENNVETVTQLIAPRTSEQIAEQFGVSEKTVRNAEKVADAFEQADEPVKELFKKGEISQKRLVESVKPQEETPLSNPHLNNFIFHGRQIMQAVKDLQEKIQAYENYTHSAKIRKIEVITDTICAVNTKNRLEKIHLDAYSLKTLQVCPLCDGEGCKRCSDLGFLDKQNFEYVTKDLERGLANKVNA